MAEGPAEGGGALGGAATSLRDSAKWLVGGVVVTAAGVFAGSSLTNLGSLDPAADAYRLAIAIAGAMIGFAALAMIMRRAVAVLTLESFTFRMLAEAERSGEDRDKMLRQVAVDIARKYRHSFPLTAPSLAELAAAIDRVPGGDPRLPAIKAFEARIMPDAHFLFVRARFGKLTSILVPATALAILGFGLFAWAANPPEPGNSPAPGRTLSITVSGARGNGPSDRPPPEPAPRSRDGR